MHCFGSFLQVCTDHLWFTFLYILLFIYPFIFKKNHMYVQMALSLEVMFLFLLIVSAYSGDIERLNTLGFDWQMVRFSGWIFFISFFIITTYVATTTRCPFKLPEVTKVLIDKYSLDYPELKLLVPYIREINHCIVFFFITLFLIYGCCGYPSSFSNFHW